MTALRPHSPLSGRALRHLFRANLLVLVLLGVTIFGLFNVLSLRYAARFHLYPGISTALSSRTRQMLDSLPEEVRVTALLRPSNAAFDPTRALLREYAAAGSGAVAFIDPDRDLARTEQIAQRYRLDNSECVVFEIGGRHRAVSAADLLEYGHPADAPGAARRLFRGEALFSNAIYSLTQAKRPTVHFVQGHGERSPADFDRRTGYSRVAARLRDENLDVDILHLAEAKAVPNHCALMIVAGPTKEFTPFETALIRDYLDRKGRLLLLLDARSRSGLEPLLRDWGIQLGDDTVMDPTRTLTGRELLLSTYPDHAITAPLQGIASVFYLPRSIRPIAVTAGIDKPVVAALATCSADGWAEFEPDDASPRFDPRVDVPGPLPVAVAIERGPVPGVHVQIRPTRIVVFGDSGFASNGGLVGANADLLLNSVNWLLEREELLGIAPRLPGELRLALNRDQLRRLFTAVGIVLPALVVLAGLGMAWHRRRGS